MSSTKPKLKLLPGGDDDVNLPHSDDAEIQVISAILLDTTPTSWAVAWRCGVAPGAFYNLRHRAVFELLTELFKQGELAVDVAMVAQAARAAGRWDEVGGIEGITAVSAGASTGVKVRFYSEQLKYMWDQRHCWRLAQSLREHALTLGVDRAEFVAEVGEIGSRLITLGRKDTQRLVADHIASVARAVNQRFTGKVDQSRWVNSSLPSFNKLCKPYNSGIQNDGLVLVGGGSGTGKSVWLRQEASQCLDDGGTVLFISRETGTEGVAAMMAAAKVGVDLNNVDRELPDRMARFLEETTRLELEVADKRLFVVQQEPSTPIDTVEDVVEMVRVHVHRRGVPSMICIDYLQLFETKKRTQSREQTVAVVSHALQSLQRELGCVMIVAAQLNESGLAEMRTLKRDENGKVIHRMPKPGDLRESQAMYHDADRVIFLYKPPVDCRDSDQTMPGVAMPEVWIYQEKRRSGGIVSVRTWFEKRYTRFVELSRSDLVAAAGGTRAPVVKGALLSKQDWMKQKGGA